MHGNPSVHLVNMLLMWLISVILSLHPSAFVEYSDRIAPIARSSIHCYCEGMVRALLRKTALCRTLRDCLSTIHEIQSGR